MAEKIRFRCFFLVFAVIANLFPPHSNEICFQLYTLFVRISMIVIFLTKKPHPKRMGSLYASCLLR